MVSEYDAWEHICADAFDDLRTGIVVLLTAYFDATDDPTVKGRPDRPLLHGVGCYLAYRDDWKRVRREWKAELDKKGLRYFHATDFEWALNQVINDRELPKDNPYCGWKREEFVEFQKRLYRVLNRKRHKQEGAYRLAAFCSSVHKIEFDANLPAELKDDPECQSYYIFNVANTMKQIAWWCNRHFPLYQRNPIHYIFANGDNEGGNLEKWFNLLWQDPGDRYYFRLHKGYSRIGYDLQWMESEPALQAADVVAFELGKVGVEVTVRGAADIPFDELRRSLPVLFQAPGFGTTLTGSELIAAFNQIIARRKMPKADPASLPPL